MAYGDVAELLGSGGPRQVGTVMSHYGSGVPWWRVLKASGQAPEGHEAEALRHYLWKGRRSPAAYESLRSGRARAAGGLTSPRPLGTE